MKIKLLNLFLLLALSSPLLAQPVNIKFLVGSEVTTELTSLSDIHVITTHGPYNFNEIQTMSFWKELPDSATVASLRNNGIGVYQKGKYLKPNSEKSAKAWAAKVSGSATRKDSIWIKKNSFWQGPVKMEPRDILTVLESDPASHNEAVMARHNLNGLQIVSFVAGAMIGWPLGQAIAGKQDPQWGLAAGGVAFLIVGGLPLSSGFKKHTEKAIKIYNQKIPSGSAGLSIEFTPALNGGTLIVRF